MSIFEANTCPVCKTRDREKTKDGKIKKRCKHCSERCDAAGVAFLIHCDFHVFTNLGRGTITFWIYDEIVQRAPVPFGYCVGMDIDELYNQMNDLGRHPADIEKAIQP